MKQEVQGQEAVPAAQAGGADVVGAPDALAESAVDVCEARSLCPLLLPAVQHELVQRRGAVDGRRQPEAVLDRFNDL